MDSAALRPIGPIAHDPLPRRDDAAGSVATTDLPTEKTVRAPQAASDSGAADNRRRQQEQPSESNIRTGYERDPGNGSIIYQWVDQRTDEVILQIPRADKIRTRQIYEESTAAKAAAQAATQAVDRSV